MAHFIGSIPRSLHIFLARSSLISECLGTDDLFVLSGIAPPGMSAAFPNELTTFGSEVLEQFSPFHALTAIFSSLYSLPAESIAS